MKFSSFFADDSGALSVTRLLLFIVVVAIMGLWFLVGVRSNALPDFPASVVTLIGLFLGTKLFQNQQEK